MRTALCALLLLAAPAYAFDAAAQTVRLDLDPAAEALLAEATGLGADDLAAALSGQLEGLYGLSNTETFLRLSANAQSLSNRGLGVYYGSDVDHVVLGFGLNFSADAGDADLESLQASRLGDIDRAVPIGTGAQMSLMLGYNLAAARLPALTLFVNGMTYPLRIGAYDGRFVNLGVHAKYQLIRRFGRRWPAAWGGLAVNSGLEVSRMRLRLDRPLISAIAAGPVIIDATSTGRIELTQRAYTVPIELSTDLNLLYIVSLYGGIGLDIQLGSAALDLSATAELEDPDIGTLGTASLQASVDGPPDRIAARVFAGVQLNLGPLAAFFQMHIRPRDQAVAGTTGLQLVL